MTTLTHSFAQLSNQDLLDLVKRLATEERQATARLIASLIEVEIRRLYLGEGCSSLFTYCTQVLHLSEHAAYGRIEAARAARRFPRVLELLAEGAITLTAVGLLAPHLTADNHVDLLASARHKTKRDVEHLVAVIRPRADIRSTVRKLPAPKPPPVPSAQTVDAQPGAASRDCENRDEPGWLMPVSSKTRAVAAPLAPERYKVQFTVGRETFENCVEPRTCSDTPSRTAIRPPSSIGRSRCFLESWKGPGSPQRNGHGPAVQQHQARGTFPLR